MKARTSSRILVVQADKLGRRAVARRLRQVGHRVFEAATCRAGLRLVTAKLPDAVVLDTPSPNRECLEACRKLKANPRTSDIPVLQIAATQPNSRQQLQSLKSGVDVFLLGPLTPGQVEEQVEALLRARRAETQLRANQQLLAAKLEELETARAHVTRQNAELEFERKRYHQLFNLAPNAYLVTDLRGWIRDANVAACQLLNLRKKLLLELPLMQFIGVLDWAKIQELLAGLRQRVPAASRAFETRVRPHKAPERLCAIAVNLERNAARKPVGLRWLLRDITGQRQTEELLRSSEEHYRALVNKLYDGIFALDLSGRFVFANPACERISGYSIPELLEKNFAELCVPEDTARLQHLFQAYLRDEGVPDVETALLRKDGERVDVLVSSSRIIVGGRLAGVQCCAKDVTWRKRAEEELRRSHDRFHLAAELLHEALWEYHVPTGRLWWNGTYDRLFGPRPHDPQNPDKWWLERIHPDDRARLCEHSQQLITGRAEHASAEYRLRRSDGSYAWVLDRARLMRDEHGQPLRVVGAILDLTDIRQAEQELRHAKAALAGINADLERQVAERTAKLRQTVGELEHLAYAMAHDMRAPLRAMQGFAELLLARCGECGEPSSKDYFRRMIGATRRMDQLVTGVLNYSKAVVDRFPLELVDPLPLLRGIIETYPNFQPNRARIRLQQPLPHVRANEAALTQCFSQLLGNAVKFVPPDKTPRVRVWAETKIAADEHPVMEKASPTDLPQASSPATCHSAPLVRFWFEDNGIGIEGDFQARLFALFEQRTAECEGVGIGLALVRKLVERMGGRIGVESQPGHGSRFWLELSGA